MGVTQFGVVLLAAGASSRMGTAKQLLEFRGKPLLRHAAEVALASMCQQVIVVLGANAEQVRPALDGLPVKIIENPIWAVGMGTSIHAGVHFADQMGLDGLILALADQPLVTSQTMDRLLAEFLHSGPSIVAARYAESVVGVPAFFAREFYPQLLAIDPSQGCKALIVKCSHQAIFIDCPEAEADVDTRLDYERFRLSKW